MSFPTPERWRRIEAVLDEVLDLDPDQWAACLDRACAGDLELRRDVEALVLADRQAGDFLEAPFAATADLGGPEPRQEPSDGGASIGERIGRYRIIRELGRGGMGVVYLAERADGHFEQRVALKLIRRGTATVEGHRRFLRERQILADLRHPDIAGLLDGGVTADGRPYLVMEYVEGVPITRYCDDHRLAVEDRVRLFLRVCEAVRCAHESRIVHRDLKPANILVTGSGDLKLLDFGIAKPVERESDSRITVTRIGLHPMTPEYAAPEQILGKPVSAATDVYALGVVLYELLSGHRPYRLEGRSAGDLERVVCRELPLRPSTFATKTEEVRRPDGSTERVTPDIVGESRQAKPHVLRRVLAGGLDQVVLRAMAKEPERRYDSAAALGRDLERWSAGRPVLARRGWVVHRVRAFVRRQRAASRMGLLGALILGAGALFVVTRSGPSTRPTTDVGGAAGAASPSPMAEVLHQEGLRAYREGDLNSARRLFHAALTEDPTFAAAIYYALTTDFQLALPRDTALERRLLRLADRLPERERLLLRGRIAWSTADPSLLAVAETLITRHPDDPEGWLLRGRASMASADPNRAGTYLGTAVRMDEEGLAGGRGECHACEALGTLVSAYVMVDSLEAAERTARRWVEVRPGDGPAWHNLAKALELQGRREEALAAIRRAAPLQPANPYVPIYPALLDIRAGDFEGADRLLREQARAGTPAVQTEALWFLAISLRYQGRMLEALETARRLRHLRPGMREPVIAEAQVLFEMGRAREAAELFDSLAASPGHGALDRGLSAQGHGRSWTLTHAAEARATEGDTAAVRILVDSVRVLGARSVWAQRQRLHHHVRGVLLLSRGDTAEAVRELYRATFRPFVPGSTFTRTNLELGRGLLALGRPDEAVRALLPALRSGLEAGAFYLTHTELHELTGRALEEAGKPEEARIHYDWVLRAWSDADPRFHLRREAVRARLEALGPRPP